MDFLNPWIIESEKRSKDSLRVRIVSNNTGEIRMIDLSVDDIAALITVGKDRVIAASRIIWEDEEKEKILNDLLGEKDA